MSQLPETSESLIARVKDPADAAAWSEFLAIYRPVVYRLARRRGLQDADAEDLVQQVFMAVSQAIDGWQPGADRPPFRAWLAKVAKNAILNALTRRKPDLASGRTSVQELLAEWPDHDGASASELVRESRRELFRFAAEEIRPEFGEATWSMFWETAVNGRPVEEVAGLHKRSSGAVYMARCHVMKRLKDRIGEATRNWELTEERSR